MSRHISRLPVLTALVVDDEPDARRRVAGLLRLGGWRVREATGANDALRLAATEDLDLVVTDVAMPGQDGLTMLRRLRVNGSRARFLVVTADPTDEVRAVSAASGAMACLAKPVEARILLDFLRSRTTGPAAEGAHSEIHELDDMHDDDVDAELMDRLQEIYVNALPARLSAIATSTRSGDTTAVASAAHTLAGTSGQLGHPEVASVCQAIAADARRGVLAHARVVHLQALALAGG
ncbi:MAG: response regulator [Geodermatophilales bacterium]|nr:response regulator [Geodermatophilales bacterium]